MSDGIVVVFRSRLDPEHHAEYERWGARMDELSRSIRGFRAIKTFVADDGERVSLAEFDDMDCVMEWRAHGEHQEAQRLGRERFYTEYQLQSCQVLRTTRFARSES